MLVKLASFSILVLFVSMTFAESQEQRTPPGIVKKDAIAASLQALQSNGVMNRIQQRAQTTQLRARSDIAVTASVDSEALPVPIKHVLVCDTESDCQAASDWGNNNNFNATTPLVTHGHGGELQYHLYFRQAVQPDTDVIHVEAMRVHEGVESLEGVRYASWMVDIDPDGENDREGEQ